MVVDGGKSSGRKECAKGERVTGKGYANSAQKEERGVGRYEGRKGRLLLCHKQSLEGRPIQCDTGGWG